MIAARRFDVISKTTWPGKSGERTIELKKDDWNDYGFETTFHMFIRAASGEIMEVGTVKIATLGMRHSENEDSVKTPIQRSFQRLSEEFVSVGQDSSYYENLINIAGLEEARAILESMQDLAHNPNRIEEVVNLPVVSESLLRYIGTETISEQFHRILQGAKAQVDWFDLKYRYMSKGKQRTGEVNFLVERNSSPPTNIHVLIGPNGAGKSRALKDMRTYFDESSKFQSSRSFLSMKDGTDIAGVVAVSFSAFDTDASVPIGTQKNPKYTVADVRYDSEKQLSEQFTEAINGCLDSGPDRLKRLKMALKFLESDSFLLELKVSDTENLLAQLNFDDLSSGHKIVLLTIVNLVRLVDEKCLVLLDEPETHLHPPLLAALIRSVSWLLNDRNGLAIIATHSPVVLQEVPRSCAWRVTRSGQESRIDAIQDETFGENVGVLTQDVFRLELKRSGYYQILRKAAEASVNYNEALQRLGGHLGEEASLLLRGMTARRK